MIKISLSVFIFFLAFPGVAQQSLNLTGDYEKNNYITVLDCQRDYLNNLYYQKVGDADELINGKEYFPYYYRANLKPLLFIEKKYTASVMLSGRKFSDIFLQYDTYLDEVVFSDSNKVINNRFIQIALNKNSVDKFSLCLGQDSLIFRNFRSENGINFSLEEGFYEVVYDGESKYIIKHQSVPIEKEGIDEYYYRPAGYVIVGKEYSRIRSTREFIKLFGERSEEVSKFIRSMKVKISKADKKQVVSILKYYDRLKMTD